MADSPHHELAGLILGFKKPEGEEEDGKDEHDEALRSAAEDLISAVHAKDADAVADALKDAYAICEACEEEHGEDEDEEHEEEQ